MQWLLLLVEKLLLFINNKLAIAKKRLQPGSLVGVCYCWCRCCYRLSSPLFDPSEWELAFGRSAPRHLLQADRHRSSAVSTAADVGCSMWSDVPWHLYIHYHPELLPGLLTPTPIPPSIAPSPTAAASATPAAGSATQQTRQQQQPRQGAAAERVPLKWRNPPRPEKEQQQLLQLLLEGASRPQQQQQQQQELQQQQQTRAAAAWSRAAATRLWGRNPRSASTANSPWRRFSAWPSSSTLTSTATVHSVQNRQQQQLAVRCRWLGLSGLSCCRGWVAVLGRDGRLCCFDALEGRLLQQQQQHKQQEQRGGLPEGGAETAMRECLPLSSYATSVYRKVSNSSLTSAAHLGSWRLLTLGCADGSIYLQHLPQRDLEPSSLSSSSSSSGLMNFYGIPAGARKEKQRVIGHLDSVLSLSYEGTEGCLVSGAADATVRVWGATPAALLLQRLFDEPVSEVTATAACGPLVLAGTATGQLLLWDLRCASAFVWGAPQGGLHDLRGPIRACGFAEGSRVTAIVHTPQAAATLRRQEQQQLQQIGVERPHSMEQQQDTAKPSTLAATAGVADAAAAADAAFPVQVWELRGSSRVPPRAPAGAPLHPMSPSAVVTCGALDDSGLALLATIESSTVPATDGPAVCTTSAACRAGVRLVDCLKREEISWTPLSAVEAPRYISVWPAASASAPSPQEGSSSEGPSSGAWGPTVVAVGEAGGAVEVLWV